MKKYIIEHYPESGIYFARVNRWFFSYIRIWSNADPDLSSRDHAGRFTTMAGAEHAIRCYHESKFRSSVKSFDLIINEAKAKKHSKRIVSMEIIKKPL